MGKFYMRCLLTCFFPIFENRENRNIRKSGCSDFPEFQKSDFRKSGFPNLRKSGFPAFRNSKSPASDFRFPKIRISKSLKIRNFPISGASDVEFSGASDARRRCPDPSKKQGDGLLSCPNRDSLDQMQIRCNAQISVDNC